MDGLVPETQFLDDLSVGIDVRTLQVVEQTATLAIHLQQPTTTMMIVLVGAEVVVQVFDALGEERHLNPGRSRVSFVRPVFLDGRAFIESHVPELLPAALAVILSFSVSFVA
jgi:magnesium-transporting ATPase (P-type)